jgi:hypothetical protein
MNRLAANKDTTALMTFDEMRAAIREGGSYGQKSIDPTLRTSTDPVEHVVFLLDLESRAEAMLPVLDLIEGLRQETASQQARSGQEAENERPRPSEPLPIGAIAALADDELIPLLRSCTYDRPHITDEDRQLLSYRLAHSPVRLLPAGTVSTERVAMIRRAYAVLHVDHMFDVAESVWSDDCPTCARFADVAISAALASTPSELRPDHNHPTGRTPPHRSTQEACPACVANRQHQREMDLAPEVER